MKLVLASHGLHTPEITKKTAELARKNLDDLNVAVINEAAAIESGDKTWFINQMSNLRGTVGGQIDFINLLALDIKTIEKRIEFADIVYVLGGHTDYLMSVYQRTGFDKLLLDKLLKEKVYVGSSAGSMVLGRRISTELYYKVFRENELQVPVTEYMSIVDFAIFPHLNSQIFTNNRPEIIAEATADFTYPVYALEDTQAVIVDGDEISFIGGEPFTINPTS